MISDENNDFISQAIKLLKFQIVYYALFRLVAELESGCYLMYHNC